MSSSVESFARVLQASRVFFRHHKSSSCTGKTKQLLVGHREKSLLVSKRVDKVATRKWHPGSLEAEEQLNGMCKANCTRSSGVEKKVQKSNPSNRNIRRKSRSKEPKQKPLKKCRWKKAERFRKYWRWPNNLQRNPLLYGSLRGGAIPHRGPANYSDYVI